ncbi:GtrA family protein, partial [Jatrophihabitans endophyticus]|uniref:GtrA family protein n=1 Tax=Jatrophihabitans endophyticus TaxID=1206085 RepID=UPI0019E18F87
DTELLVLAERSGMRIAEVPVDWIDDPDSRVDITSTALDDLLGIVRVGRALVRGDVPLSELRAAVGRDADFGAGSAGGAAGLPVQAIRFAVIGVASTLAYLVLFSLLRGSTDAQAANLLAMLVTAVANTAANRRFTFGVRGGGHGRHQLQGLAVFAIGLALTSGSLWLLAALDPSPGRALELGVLVVANLAATAVRFVLFRHWVFSRPLQEVSR